MIGSKIVVSGPDRIAKLIPATPSRPGDEYPPGLGIFQIKILHPLPFRVKAAIAPGQKWLGDYA
jgi:hypothetical protein